MTEGIGLDSFDRMMNQKRSTAYFPTRTTLVARARAGDQQAWSELHGFYWRAVYSYALRFGTALGDVDDVVQEVFVKIARRLPEFEYDRSKGRFLGWVKTIVRTTVVDYFRRRKARPEEVTEAPPEPQVEPITGSGDEDRRELLLALALERVQTKYKKSTTMESFRLYAIGGKPPEEVASSLGISVGQVYTNRSRVLQDLRDEVKVIAAEEEEMWGAKSA